MLENTAVVGTSDIETSTETDNGPASEVGSKTRKARTSSRLLAMNEAIGLVENNLKRWDEEKPGKTRDAAVSLLNHVRDELIQLRDDGKPKSKQDYTGFYYVGVTQAKERLVFQSERIPTQATHGAEYDSVLGPFRMAKSAGTHAGQPSLKSPVVF